ncbi:MAG: flagellar basal body-associated FliL family protein [Bacillota bacterium]
MRSKKVLVLAAVLLAALAGGGWYYVRANPSKSKPAPQPTIIHAGEFVTNLLPNGPYRYIRVEVDVEVDTKEGATKFAERSSQAKDTILRVLRSKKWEDVLGSQGMEQLASEMKEQLSKVIAPDGSVTRVFFTQFVVQ